MQNTEHPQLALMARAAGGASQEVHSSWESGTFLAELFTSFGDVLIISVQHLWDQPAVTLFRPEVKDLPSLQEMDQMLKNSVDAIVSM